MSGIAALTTLEGGLRVATAEMPHMASVSVGIWVANGSRHESVSENGISHFIEHLLFKGTAKRSAAEISQAVEGIGGYLNAFTSEEMTCFHAKASAEHFETLLEVLMDMLLHARFAPADIRKEREVIKEEIAMYLDEPQHQVQELLNATLWPDQPLGRSITGTPSSLDAVSRRMLLGYLRSRYVSGSVIIVTAGKVRHAEALRAVKRFARYLPMGPKPGYSQVEERQTSPQVCLFTKKTEQTQIALAVRAFSRHDPRRYALRLLNVVLGENMSSRLFQVIREDRGLAYSICSNPSFFDDTGDLVISCGLDAANLEKTLRLVVREFRRLANRPIDSSELKRACDYVIGQMDLSLENTENQMNWVGEQLLGYGRVFHPSRLKQRLKAVTATEVNVVARELFRPARLTLAMVTPLRNSRPVERVLDSF